MQKINWLTLLFTLFASSYFDKVLAGLDTNWLCVAIDVGDFRRPWLWQMDSLGWIL